MCNQIQEPDDDPLARLKGQKMVSCRICKGDHWTTKCPYKDSLAPLQESLDGDKKKDEPASNTGQQAASTSGLRPGKYVPPSLREGGNRKGESMSLKNRGLTRVYVIIHRATSNIMHSSSGIESECRSRSL